MSSKTQKGRGLPAPAPSRGAAPGLGGLWATPRHEVTAGCVWLPRCTLRRGVAKAWKRPGVGGCSQPQTACAERARAQPAAVEWGSDALRGYMEGLLLIHAKIIKSINSF